MAVSTYLGNALLNFALRGVALTPPTAIYISLHTADPGVTGSSEIAKTVWPSYARKESSNGEGIASGFTAPAAKQSKNTKQLLFASNDGTATVTVTHIGLWDAPTGGNFLFGSPLAAAREFNPTDEAVFYPSRMTLSVE